MGFSTLYRLYAVTLILSTSVLETLCIESNKAAIYQSILVAQCRSLCIDHFIPGISNPPWKLCRDNSNCHMCWETCGMLTNNFYFYRQICYNTLICFPGCRFACDFYIRDDKNIYNIDYSVYEKYDFKYPFVINYFQNKDVLTWGPPQVSNTSIGNLGESPKGTIVYTIVGFYFDTDSWYPVSHILKTNVKIGPIRDDDKRGYMLIAVNGTHVLAKQQRRYLVEPNDPSRCNNTMFFEGLGISMDVQETFHGLRNTVVTEQVKLALDGLISENDVDISIPEQQKKQQQSDDGLRNNGSRDEEDRFIENHKLCAYSWRYILDHQP